MMVKKSVILVCLSLLSITTFGQTLKDRLFFGGNFGFVAGNYTDIEISPTVGYYLMPRWSVGVGITYEYFNDRYYWPNYQTGMYERCEGHIWGGRLFTNYVIINDFNNLIPVGLNFRIFAHVEYEALSYPERFFIQDAEGRRMFNSFLVGGGVRFPIGARSSMNLTILWNLNSDLNSLYGSTPIIRFGFNF